MPRLYTDPCWRWLRVIHHKEQRNRDGEKEQNNTYSTPLLSRRWVQLWKKGPVKKWEQPCFDRNYSFVNLAQEMECLAHPWDVLYFMCRSRKKSRLITFRKWKWLEKLSVSHFKYGQINQQNTEVVCVHHHQGIRGFTRQMRFFATRNKQQKCFQAADWAWVFSHRMQISWTFSNKRMIQSWWLYGTDVNNLCLSEPSVGWQKYRQPVGLAR